MKKRIFTLLLVTAIGFSACQKENDKQVIAPNQVSQKPATSTTGLNQDTLSVNGYMRVQLAMDSVNTDNILINFNPTAQTTFNLIEDAPTLQGLGLVSLSSLSSDGRALSIYTLPLTSKGDNIAIRVSAKTSGNYKLNLGAVSNVPTTFKIWLKDNYKKDSVNFASNPSYTFALNTADTSTYGNHRFSLVLRQGN